MTRQGMTRQGMTRQGMTRQGMTRQGMTRQGPLARRPGPPKLLLRDSSTCSLVSCRSQRRELSCLQSCYHVRLLTMFLTCSPPPKVAPLTRLYAQMVP
jgi:hypothetical protein